jgi:hypothetical protein
MLTLYLEVSRCIPVFNNYCQRVIAPRVSYIAIGQFALRHELLKRLIFMLFPTGIIEVLTKPDEVPAVTRSPRLLNTVLVEEYESQSIFMNATGSL